MSAALVALVGIIGVLVNALRKLLSSGFTSICDAVKDIKVAVQAVQLEIRKEREDRIVSGGKIMTEVESMKKMCELRHSKDR